MKIEVTATSDQVRVMRFNKSRKLTTGSANWVTLNDSQSERLHDAIIDNPRLEKEAIVLGNPDTKYSPTMVVTFRNRQVGLYSSYGELRLATGGGLTTKKVMNELDVGKFIQGLIQFFPKATIIG